jgi:asparagine synthase (glutamine-hydrolysing)
MCGIAGVLSFSADAPDADLLRRMTATLRHRGPDGEGIWRDGPVGLGMTRLAIIDLSERASQPMTNEDGSLWVVFNGEIYNFQALREELVRRGHVFRSAGDTETILHLYEEHGAACLDHLRGMFAFALWDRPRQTLFLARDRLGKKPLVYYQDSGVFLFASEPKALLQHPRLRAQPDPEAIHHYLTYGYVPSPWSAFQGVRKLPPGHHLTVQGGQLARKRYWSLRYTPKRTGPEAALAEALGARLEEAVRLRLISDVPLGALLSGGLDSSAVVAVARRFASGPLRTFSVGFGEPEYDELAYARMVAQRFETDHHELVVKPDAVSLLPRLVWHYNEPFADSSAVPSLALCEMARQFVTVALSGDGGDEAFLGYDRYRAAKLAGWQDRLPVGVRRGAAWAARRIPTTSPRSARQRLRRFAEALPLPAGRRYGRWLTVMDEPLKRELYTDEFAACVGAVDSLALLDTALERSDAPEFAEAVAHSDVEMYLPDDLLVKMDIASMAHSLEVRSPFLDYEVVEFAARVPASLKLRGLTSKYLLKQTMRGVLPEPVRRRPKMGFGVPIDRWFRHELRDMAWDLLLDSRARGRGYFRPAVVRRWLEDHAAGRATHHTRLWSLLVLELWHRTFIDQPCPAAPPALPG